MNILELSKKRFSARKYTAEPVSKEDLDYLKSATIIQYTIKGRFMSR